MMTINVKLAWNGYGSPWCTDSDSSPVSLVDRRRISISSKTGAFGDQYCHGAIYSAELSEQLNRELVPTGPFHGMSDSASALDAASTAHHSSLNTGNCLTMIVKSSTLMRPTIVTCQRCLQASVISDFTEKDPNAAFFFFFLCGMHH